MKNILIISTIILTGIFFSCYHEMGHKPLEKINNLIGKNYDYAYKTYFRTEPDQQYKININEPLNEFDGGIYNNTENLTDSIVYVYTWEFANYKKTIWVGKTEKMNKEIIDAIRYNNNLKF